MTFNRLPLDQKLLTKAKRSESGCLEWFGQKDARGYGRLFLAGRHQRAHRLMYELVHGPIPEGKVVRHRCDNVACIEPDHLELGTQFDNVQDMWTRGRGRPMPGEQNPRAKLTAQQVADIRRRYAPRCRTNGSRALAREFGVSHPVIRAIVNGRLWKSV